MNFDLVIKDGTAIDDLVLFDPTTVADNTTPDRSDAPPTGIKTVLISGHVVAQDGQIISQERWGRVLRK